MQGAISPHLLWRRTASPITVFSTRILRGAEHRFAQAGLGAAPLVEEDADDGADQADMVRQEQMQRQPSLLRRLVANLVLIGKLVLLVWLFGHDATPTRFAIICSFAVCVFLYQCGWFTLQRAATPRQPRAAEREDAPVDDPDLIGRADIGQQQPPQALPADPPSLTAGIGTVIARFFTSMIPERQAA